jgi:hypothetical protein
MKKAVLLLVACLGGAGLVGGQSPEWADKLFAAGGTSHNFGNVPCGAVLHYRFAMTNIYAVPLQITGTRVSCGCVTVTPSTQILQPRETAHIDVHMDARRFTGPKTVNIFITVGPEYTSTATLQVSANSRADVVFNPGQVSFGAVPAGQTATQSIDVEYAGVLDWRITGITPHSFPLDVQYRELYRRPGQVGYRLQVTLTGKAPPGSFKHELYLQTNDPASTLVPVLVEGTVQASLTVLPAAVPLRNAKVGQEAIHKVLLSSNATREFRIVAVEGTGNGLTVDFPTAADRGQKIITIKWRPTQPGSFRQELLIRTDLDGGATAKVLVEGNALP